MAKTMLLRSESHFPDAGSPLAVFRQNPQQPLRTHAHEFIEIVLILSGTGLHSTGAAKHSLTKGDVMVIQKKRSHAYEETSSLNLVNVLIRPEVLGELSGELGKLPGYHPLFTFEFTRWKNQDFSGRLRLNAEDLKIASSWVDCIEEESRRGNQGGHILARSWLVLLIGFLSSRYGKETKFSTQLDIRLGTILSAIDRNPLRDHTLSSMSREAGMSERSFLRYFKKATTYSPTDYVIRSRIQKAAEILVREEKTITEIAFECGFNDSNYFTRQFRRITGKSPREFQRASDFGAARLG